MSKIKEILIEPTKLQVGSFFKLKIKAFRGISYQESKDSFTYSSIQDYHYSNLKGD